MARTFTYTLIEVALDNGFSTMNMVYEQNGKLIETFFTQATRLPAEGRLAIKAWMSACRSGCNDYKQLLDDNDAKVEANFE